MDSMKWIPLGRMYAQVAIRYGHNKITKYCFWVLKIVATFWYMRWPNLLSIGYWSWLFEPPPDIFRSMMRSDVGNQYKSQAMLYGLGYECQVHVWVQVSDSSNLQIKDTEYGKYYIFFLNTSFVSKGTNSVPCVLKFSIWTFHSFKVIIQQNEYIKSVLLVHIQWEVSDTSHILVWVTST